ncbi:chemotaxis protein CheW [Clostridium sp. AF19-22AC]|mgnify:CR=1 FL=1|jgi:purine-binding chemotaxis protein CheW|uniref:Chemotaxis signal transduction protein n=1 Tax=Faecalicatena orotica TaxID=1544 RepID=A0A2Y9CAH0_9FIRM|nr:MULTISPECIES: chemotaxis protein CheW [Clostridia]PWJ23864.1 chemotaxis signal transduction protein [Faecalicatena orotica]RHR28638.1 chemotaxis protein CheW [Clostridium sp. AF19-22AC]SSA57423.1 Chemotaxis signal transduction protein [Faecalicatena orotica]
MEIENDRELLCIRGKKKNYAFEFRDIREICRELKISRMPCLPEHFTGVCNYKGGIVPVLCIEETEPEEERTLVFIFEYQNYQLGILYSGEPYILDPGKYTEIQRPESESACNEIWIEKKMILADEEIYTVLDMEKIIWNLAKFFQGEYMKY